MPIDNLVRGRITEQLREATADIFEIEGITYDVEFMRWDYAVRLEGRFLTPTEPAYDTIAKRAHEEGYLIFFRREEGQPILYAVKDEIVPHTANYRVAVILFVATLTSVFFVAGFTADFNIDWEAGLTYALPLMTILLAHELGHFFVARHHKMATSPPYFIPLPITILGTLGAVIFMTVPPKNRRHLLQMGAAGPLAGLVFAIPILLVGLSLSAVAGLPQGVSYMMEGNSLFYVAAKFMFFRQILPTPDGMDVMLHNMAFAGWVGLLVTALNLIPAGQLDGGHAAFTLFGERIRPLTYILIAVFLLLAIQHPSWLIWAGLLFAFGRTYAVPMDDLTPLDGKHKALAVFMLVLGALLFVPNPLIIVNP